MFETETEQYKSSLQERASSLAARCAASLETEAPARSRAWSVTETWLPKILLRGKVGSEQFNWESKSDMNSTHFDHQVSKAWAQSDAAGPVASSKKSTMLL